MKQLSEEIQCGKGINTQQDIPKNNNVVQQENTDGALIGRGSFSRVVRVEHKATKQSYAIKMIETKYREGREVCESELCVLRHVRHTNIIQLIEVFETQERVYMVMELATRGELSDWIIAKGSFTERDATRVLQMVLDGVKYLHTLGITRRDLKPENLLYYHPGIDSKIMITDFGLAIALPNPISLGMFVSGNCRNLTCTTSSSIMAEPSAFLAH
uniref:Protein kinase domain-containing protein n=1 Tax=Monodelphis domestica TaxID=13616 RepID=A0A5F8GUC3_MONDO